MALIKPIHGEMKGSIGGNTYQGNPYGQIVRQRVKPVDPNTTIQNEFRQNFNNASSVWKGLTAAEKSAWATYADTAPRLNKFGDTIFLAARAMFMSITSFQQAVGVAVVPTAPTVPGNAINDPTLSFFASTAIGLRIDAPTVVPTSPAASLIRATVLPGSERVFYKGPYNYRSSLLSTSTLPQVVIPAAALNVGDTIYIVTRSIDEDGRISPNLYLQIPISS